MLPGISVAVVVYHILASFKLVGDLPDDAKVICRSM